MVSELLKGKLFDLCVEAARLTVYPGDKDSATAPDLKTWWEKTREERQKIETVRKELDTIAHTTAPTGLFSEDIDRIIHDEEQTRSALRSAKRVLKTNYTMPGIVDNDAFGLDPTTDTVGMFDRKAADIYQTLFGDNPRTKQAEAAAITFLSAANRAYLAQEQRNPIEESEEAPYDVPQEVVIFTGIPRSIEETPHPTYFPNPSDNC